MNLSFKPCATILWLSPSLRCLKWHCVSPKLFLILEDAQWTLGFPINDFNSFEPFPLGFLLKCLLLRREWQSPSQPEGWLHSCQESEKARLLATYVLCHHLSKRWWSAAVQPCTCPSPQHTLKDAGPVLDSWWLTFIRQALIQHATEESTL